jgi:hypothetical protein
MSSVSLPSPSALLWLRAFFAGGAAAGACAAACLAPAAGLALPGMATANGASGTRACAERHACSQSFSTTAPPASAHTISAQR